MRGFDHLVLSTTVFNFLRDLDDIFSPVHVTRFMNDKLRVFSGGDDNVVRLYDIPSETELQTFCEHEVRNAPICNFFMVFRFLMVNPLLL